MVKIKVNVNEIITVLHRFFQKIEDKVRTSQAILGG